MKRFLTFLLCALTLSVPVASAYAFFDSKSPAQQRSDILKQNEAVVENYAKAWKPDMYQPWTEIQDSLDAQLKYATSQPITTPPLSAYAR